ncbi:hypothetical protein HNQ51_001711 [Inhella inkyongensis]|uniref:Uncharacterized protein n=1 Tax=Inhella inkyongensis TaxID=392593 RepID=A0A840S018_9BURK|nr:hypothetical protein [Inhella inkyongensis]MBB5204397.1 hypothetical protein [Inhella inkyongensis]
MALIFSESFETGIPGGFATTLTDYGTLTASYDGAAKAALLTKDGYNAVWRLNTAPVAATVRVLLDVEHVSADNAGSSSSGFGPAFKFVGRTAWSMAGVSAEGGYLHFGSGSDGSPVGFATNDAGTVYYEGQGARHVYEFLLTAASGATIPTRWLRVKRGGAVQATVALPTYPRTALESLGIFMRDSTQKIHSIEVYDDADGFVNPDLGLLPSGEILRIFEASPPPVSYLAGPMGANVLKPGGTGRVIGTVKAHGSPDQPLARRVRLFRDIDGLLVGETWSDATTGAYVFTELDRTQRYSAVSYDHEGHYRAVIADNLMPEPMP